MTLKLVKHPAAVLRQVAQPVTDYEEASRVAQDMGTVIVQHGAYGLAANQVGVPLRIVAVSVPQGIFVACNPEIEVVDPTLDAAVEMCLSLPGTKVKIARPRAVRMRCTALDGQPREVNLKGSAARVVLHEVDHLNGKLILDYL